MNQCVFDSDLIDALLEMAVANWPASQKILAGRLERAKDVGNERLNLFLLSVSAASGGYEDVANQLWSQAQSAAIDNNVLRYFDLQLAPNDPRQTMLIDLEKAWWDFNGWNQTASSLQLEKADSIDWDFVVEAALSGNCSAIEERYARSFGGEPIEGAFLWNFLALAYLEAGDVRTYEEMVQNSPPLPPPDSLPSQLQTALDGRELLEAGNILRSGHWLTNLELTSAQEPSPRESESLDAEQWTSRMKEGFFLLDLGRFLEAAREFQKVNYQTENPQQLLLGLNALALTFFKEGDYTQCEKVYEEFRNWLDRYPLDPNSELAQQYLAWLRSIDATPPEGQVFFSPFGSKSSWNESDSLEQEELDFWKQFDRIVNFLAEDDHIKARVALQKLEVHLGSSLDSFQRYLLCMLFLAASVMAGDYAEVQELSSEFSGLEADVIIPQEQLESVADSLRWAGFERLQQRLVGGETARAVPFNPWEDVLRS